MGAAHDLFREVGPMVYGKPDAYETLCRAAELWRAQGQPFSAGVAMLGAVDAAWGRPELMLDAHRAALRDFESVVVEQPSDTPEALAALHKLLRTLGRALWLFEEEDRDTVRSRIRELESELSQRLLTHFKCPSGKILNPLNQLWFKSSGADSWGARCGRQRTANAMTAANCAIRAIWPTTNGR